MAECVEFQIAAGVHGLIPGGGTGEALHERLQVLWNALSADNLPANVKYALSCQGAPAVLSRAPMPMPDHGRQVAIRAGLEGLGLPCGRLPDGVGLVVFFDNSFNDDHAQQ